MYRMIFDIIRFNLFAIDLLAHEGRADLAKLSIGEYLDKEGYGQAFKEDYLLVCPVQSILHDLSRHNGSDELMHSP
jgi:predicted NAD/FAD-binding protein